MKKKIITVLITLSLLNTPIIAQADTSLDDKYIDAYNATILVTKTANSHKVNPCSSNLKNTKENLIEAVQAGMQTQIINARNKINTLPKSIQNMKSTLSSILDEYQHPIFFETVQTLNKLSGITLKKFTGEENATDLYSSLVSYQYLVNCCRKLICDMPSVYKTSYSVAIDNYQQNILNHSIQLVNSVKDIKDGAFKAKADSALNYIKDSNLADKNITTYINKCIYENNKTIVNKPIDDSTFYNLCLKNDFKKSTCSNNCGAHSSFANQILVNKDNSFITIYENFDMFDITCNTVNVIDLKNLLSTLMPYQANNIISKSQIPGEYYTISSNGLELTIYTEPSGKLTKLTFTKYYSRL